MSHAPDLVAAAPEFQARVRAFYAFMVERETIRVKRSVGEPFPWTDDPILREFKFTNVRRVHDRTTQAFKEIYDAAASHATARTALITCATFRYFGTERFARALGFIDEFDPKCLIDVAATIRKSGDKVFTSAYMITMNGKTGSKPDFVANEILLPLWEGAGAVTAVAEQSRSWEQTATEMRMFTGFKGSGFMTKEVLLDTMFCPAMWPNGIRDEETWTPCGPGARRGVARLLATRKNVDIPSTALGGEATFYEIMQMVHEQRWQHWPSKYGTLTLHDIQFQLCEWDKYERVRTGAAASLRNRYRPKT